MDGLIERGPYGAQYIVTGLPDSIETTYQMDIMMRARPKFLLPVYRQTTGRGHRYAYPVTGLDSLADLAAARKTDPKRALQLIQRLRQDLAVLPDHLLMTEQVLLRPEALFLNPFGERLLLVYRPFVPVDGTGTPEELIRWLGQQLFPSERKQRNWIKAASVEFDAKSGNADSADAKPARKSHRQAILLAAFLIALLAGGVFIVVSWRIGRLGSMPDWRLIVLALLALSLPIQFLVLGRQRRNAKEAVGSAVGSNDGSSMSAAIGDPTANNALAAISEPLFTEKPVSMQVPVSMDEPLPMDGPLPMDEPLPMDGPLSMDGPTAKPTVQISAVSIAPAYQARERTPGRAAQWNPMAFFRRTKESICCKIAESPAERERMHEMPTELLSSRQALFRLATLSEGMIGTGAEAAGQRAFILNDEFLIGRDFRTADLCLSGHAVGRQHARISRQGAAFFITDLGSKNGTRMNGDRLNKHEAVLLPDRCQLQFADRLFYFEAEQLPVGA